MTMPIFDHIHPKIIELLLTFLNLHWHAKNQLIPSIYVNLHLHVKSQAISLICSGDMVD